MQSRIKQLEKIVPIEIDEVDTSSLRLKFPPCSRSGDYPVICEDVRKDYGDHCVFHDVNLTIKRGEKGYFKTDIPAADKEEARSIVNEYNTKLGVSKAQEEAMKAGSMFGFQVPAADPRNYDADGKPVMPKDRGDAR